MIVGLYLVKEKVFFRSLNGVISCGSRVVMKLLCARKEVC